MHPKKEQNPDYPQEYLTGNVTFFGREFIVTPDVLIPRLETEGLVRRARKILEKKRFDVIADIGTGSGIIITSVADKAYNSQLYAFDISSDALLVAKNNFNHHHAHHREHTLCHFIQMDLLEGFEEYLGKTQSILLLANLPYIKGGDWKNMSADTRFEPELALFGGEETGFELYIELFEQIRAIPIQGTLIIEFGFDQREIAENTIKDYGWQYEFFGDYAGIERFCEINIR